MGASSTVRGASAADPAVAEAMTERRTAKALQDPTSPLTPEGLDRAAIAEMIALAGNAPFHYPAHPEQRGAGPREPWRAAMLDAPACRALLAALDPADNPGKIADMLAAAEALICVSWLPDPPETVIAAAPGPEQDHAQQPVFSNRNIEHVAAASAFIQSFLILATSAGQPNYWSSGGVLGTRKYLDLLGAPEAARLLGAVFLFPKDLRGLTVKPGAMRAERAPSERWAHWVESAEFGGARKRP